MTRNDTLFFETSVHFALKKKHHSSKTCIHRIKIVLSYSGCNLWKAVSPARYVEISLDNIRYILVVLFSLSVYLYVLFVSWWLVELWIVY